MKSSKRKRESATPAAAPEAATSPAVVVKAAAKTPAAKPSCVIALASHCTVKDASALKASLAALVDESAAVTIDVSAVERIDTATMQLLCAFARDRSAGARTLAWSGDSKALREAAKLLGAGPMLALPEAGAAA
jgi:ABC-type transporter Mla MlaB component